MGAIIDVWEAMVGNQKYYDFPTRTMTIVPFR